MRCLYFLIIGYIFIRSPMHRHTQAHLIIGTFVVGFVPHLLLLSNTRGFPNASQQLNAK